ncbi:TonB-dependent receptor [Pedobacter sp. ASV28]|uniref:TonB-dependent receptor n=1 Tax=Pedobacter sp. ASV28 TaxID=2795123 RepID=UPI0018EB4216|nr:TonB-dependent receptor [Pedobacter sp. ASV28]
MRKIILLAILAFNCLAIYGQDRKLTVNLYQQPIGLLFDQIKKQCGYNIIYSDEVVADTILVSIHTSRLPVSKVLDSLLLSKRLSYQLLAENLIVIGRILQKEEMGIPRAVLSGRVVNPEGLAVPFVTISLLEDGSQVNGAIGSEHGEFRFFHTLRDKKAYVLKISSLGYEGLTVNFFYGENELRLKEFGKLKLDPKAKKLKEVNIAGNQKIIEMEGGNIVFNVSRSISAQGTNALELLGRAPGVSVGTDHNISLNGKAGAAVLIDGKQTYLSNREVAELLKSMSSSDIKSIEIINSPSAKYDASGTAGIINVRTLKSVVQGFNAAFTTGLSYGVYLRNNQDLSLNFRKNRLNIFGNYSHFIGYYSYLYGADRMQESKFYNSFTDDIDKRKKMGSRLGADFAIDKNHTIGILLNGNFIFGGGITDTRTDIGLAQTNNVDQTLTAINDYYYQKTQRYNVNLNYKYEDTLGRVVNVDADYGDFTKGSGNLQSNKYTTADHVILSDNLYRSVNAIDIGLRAIKVDYTTNLWKGKLETGAKYSSVSADNDSKFLEIKTEGEIIDPDRSNRFVYREEIANAYVNYQKTFGKWQLQAGLRVENTSSNGKLDEISSVAGNVNATERNYTNWFPFLSATIKPSVAHNFSLSYSRRIDRPAYQNLNPFIYLLDELSYWQGNPFLTPQLSHRLLLQYVYKSSTIIGLGYTYTDKFSVEVTDVVDDTKIVMVPRNLGTQQHLALTLTQMLSPYKWWNITFNGTFFGLHNDIDFGGGRKLNLKQVAGRMNLQQSFKLPYQLTAEIVGFYNSKRLAGANQFAKATSQVDIGLQHNFMDKKATLRLVFSDIYKGSKASSVQRIDGLYVHNYSYFETRQVKLNFSYRFAAGNAKGPRNRSSALENENGRIK